MHVSQRDVESTARGTRPGGEGKDDAVEGADFHYKIPKNKNML